MKKQTRSLFLTLFMIAFFTAIALSVWFTQAIHMPGPLTIEKQVYIPPGTSIRGMFKIFKSENIVDQELAFLILARWRDRHVSLKAGEYTFKPKVSTRTVIKILQLGITYQHKITVAEGLSVTEIINLLKENKVLTGDIETLPKEGTLLPETYKFSYADTRQSLVDRMSTSMQITLKDLWENRADNLPFKNMHDALVLASIVEKETGVTQERARVAGVFVNRLHKKIPLQSDPTVIYALTLGKEKLNRALTYKDLKEPSAYNTYIVQGLPPGPIANPGKDSIFAVLNPEKHKFIYFVADGTGGHIFSKTLKEHNRNVQNWRKFKKNNKNQ